MAGVLPNAQLATIERPKVTDYLLAANHPAGRAKAAFFARFGFTTVTWPRLRDALLLHARSVPAVSVSDTPFGRKYILEGPLASPDGRNPQLRSVWFVEIGETAPRFVTAYPVPGDEK
jgi:Domain of unknown function (DUF6883)